MHMRDDPTLHAGVQHLLALADTGITDYSIRELPIEVAGDQVDARWLPRRTELFMRHAAPESAAGFVDLSDRDQSLGTLRLFEIALPVLQALRDGRIFAVDELDASLHPLVVQALIELFHDDEINRHGAQLIINTHDTTLLDQTIMRRDQIWFVEKERNGASRLYPLTDFSPRKGEALEKGYLAGRYGGIPLVERMREYFRTAIHVPEAVRNVSKRERLDASETS